MGDDEESRQQHQGRDEESRPGQRHYLAVTDKSRHLVYAGKNEKAAQHPHQVQDKVARKEKEEQSEKETAQSHNGEEGFHLPTDTPARPHITRQREQAGQKKQRTYHLHNQRRR
jgi:hypothetical protein